MKHPQSENRIPFQVSEKAFWIVACAAVFIELIYLLYNAGNRSFWSDELFTTGLIYHEGGLRNILHEFLTNETCNLPAYSVMMYFWGKLVPAKETFLLIPTILATVLTVVLVGSTVKKLSGNNAGVITLLLTASSTVLMTDAAWELRAYAGFVMFSALFLWANAPHRDVKKAEIILTVSMIGLFYTHYFGFLLAGLWFVGKLLFMFKKARRSFRWMLPYFIAGAVFLPWGIGILLLNQRNFAQFWPRVPDIYRIRELFLFLCSEEKVFLYFFIAGAIAVIMGMVIHRDQEQKETDEFYVLTLFSFLAAVGIIFLYSAYINPKGSFWVERYFLCFVPGILCTSAFGVERVMNIMIGMTAYQVQKWCTAGVMLLLAAFGLSRYTGDLQSNKLPIEPYREAAQWIAAEGYEKTPIYYNKSNYEYYYVGQGWAKFYFAELVSIISAEELTASAPDKVIVPSLHKQAEQSAMDFLNEYYEVENQNSELGIACYVKKN